MQTVPCKEEVVGLNDEGADLAMSAKQPMALLKAAQQSEGAALLHGQQCSCDSRLHQPWPANAERNPLRTESMQHLYCMLNQQDKAPDALWLWASGCLGQQA